MNKSIISRFTEELYWYIQAMMLREELPSYAYKNTAHVIISWL